MSQGSSDTGFFGSMEKKEKNKRLHEGRPDAEKVINELMEGVDIIDKSVQEDQDCKFLNYLLDDRSLNFLICTSELGPLSLFSRKLIIATAIFSLFSQLWRKFKYIESHEILLFYSIWTSTFRRPRRKCFI